MTWQWAAAANILNWHSWKWRRTTILMQANPSIAKHRSAIPWSLGSGDMLWCSPWAQEPLHVPLGSLVSWALAALPNNPGPWSCYLIKIYLCLVICVPLPSAAVLLTDCLTDWLNFFSWTALCQASSLPSCLVIILACLSWAEGVRLLMSSLTGADQNRADPKAAIIRDHYLWFCFPYYCLWVCLCSGLPLRLMSRKLIPPLPGTVLPLSVWCVKALTTGRPCCQPCLPWRTRHSRSAALSSSKERSLPP